MRGTLTTALGLAAASVLTACGSSGTDADARPAPSSSSTADVAAPTFPSGISHRLAQQKGAWDLVLSDVRVGQHDGFDRVVLEFAGTGTPGWSAQYVRTPRADGSGEAVDVRGDTILAVSVSGVIIRKGYPKTPADFLHGARHFAPEHGGEIEDVSIGGVFEGYSQLFLGLDGDRVPFRVSALTNPSRLVVDVEDL